MVLLRTESSLYTKLQVIEKEKHGRCYALVAPGGYNIEQETQRGVTSWNYSLTIKKLISQSWI